MELTLLLADTCMGRAVGRGRLCLLMAPNLLVQTRTARGEVSNSAGGDASDSVGVSKGEVGSVRMSKVQVGMSKGRRLYLQILLL